MTDDVIPGTDTERQEAFLAFAAVFGGGVLAYEAVRALREKEMFDRAVEQKPAVGIVGLAVGLPLLGVSLKEAAKEYGWGPLIWGSVGITAFAMTARALRR
jgi:hypothetical protein